MVRILLFSTLLCSIAFCSNAQNLYMPRDVQQAYKNGTRSADGHPGKKYWQNKARYNIAVTATPPNRTIRGTEEIIYFNTSPEPVQYPVFRLLLNIHKPGAMRNGNKFEGYLTSGVHIDHFAVNNQQQDWPYPNGFVLHRVKLPNAVMPGDSVKFTFNWHFDLSVQDGREGMVDSTTMFLAYFYPRIAVNDDVSGWDLTNFTDQQEFYSDFNDYTVTVNVPANFVVWGTGTLQHPETLLQPDIAKRYQQSQTSDAVIHVVTKADLQSKKVTAQNNMNAWQFKASNIPDMAFGISDHFVWDAASTVVDASTGRRASVQTAYNDTAIDYPHVAGFTQRTLRWLSRNWPGIPYPYEKMTVFQGHADMEYPMMCNDDTYDSDTAEALLTVVHEVTHTYMPFYMGINETKYGFMDEGWATALEYLFGLDENAAVANKKFKDFRIAPFTKDLSSDFEIPIIAPGTSLAGNALRANQYGKAALGYLAAKDLLGDVLFKKCLQEYMKRWHGKHPIPWDFFNTFNEVSGRNLNWFWNNWFFTFNHIDLAIQQVAKTNSGYEVSIRNVGGFAIPFDVLVTYTDGSKAALHQTPAIWQANQQQAKLSIKTNKTIAALKLDGNIFMDGNDSDNEWKTL
ncbi:M1 family metallopeptidase [Pseudoflavitalea sp. G-6-1-2]|uniref:M1 family metallopeptidase n=1 Tax=Pseudoflavitalea sp. G-6-1-2 TaxID=2728841 RepID=UPI00146A7007|nr:M1 family metallopeptidase [Pseudoflavitalea sp. G-6-1-2]NML21377.1 M1 family metallopeptidase [Pseudoflavitalea sp. G-6-1-2]